MAGRQSRLLIRTATFACVMAPCVAAAASTQILASDAAIGDAFGSSVAIDGDTAIVGAFLADGTGGVDQGAAYVFRFNGAAWVEEGILHASDAAGDDYFGCSVDVDGDTAIVGASLHNGGAGVDQGAVYIFTRSGSTWSEQMKLTASDATTADEFGHSVAISGETVIVGAPLKDGSLQNQGAAYIFTRTGSAWSEQAKVFVPGGSRGARFGWSVDVDANTALIGANEEDALGSTSGAAYVMTRSGSVWSHEQQLTASDGATFDRFGHSVCLDGDNAIVGAWLDDDAGSASGSAYVFTRSAGTWSEQNKLTASDAATNDEFGFDVALEGDVALVGARLDDDHGANSGAVYLFTRAAGVWTEADKLVDTMGMEDDQFGDAVDLSGATGIVGAFADDDVASNAGSAFIFDGIDCPSDLSGDGIIDGADLADLLAQWGTNGSADLTGDGNVDGADLAALLAAWGACT